MSSVSLCGTKCHLHSRLVDERLVDVGGLLELLLVIDDVGRGALAAHQVDKI